MTYISMISLFLMLDHEELCVDLQATVSIDLYLIASFFEFPGAQT